MEIVKRRTRKDDYGKKDDDVRDFGDDICDDDSSVTGMER